MPGAGGAYTWCRRPQHLAFPSIRVALSSEVVSTGDAPNPSLHNTKSLRALASSANLSNLDPQYCSAFLCYSPMFAQIFKLVRQKSLTGFQCMALEQAAAKAPGAGQ